MWPKDFDLVLYPHKMSKACPTRTGCLLVRESCMQNVADSSFAKWSVLFPSILGAQMGWGETLFATQLSYCALSFLSSASKQSKDAAPLLTRIAALTPPPHTHTLLCAREVVRGSEAIKVSG